ncbi:MAG: N-methyl-L-tryptophan oxidase [Planctomycetales bacterium]|nr:N-methyl-L-tryptophan oxidase [Planctomycetales bacterium]
MEYDVIILGLGGVGSAAAWQSSLRSRRVLGLEQFHAGHDQGSSHGATRIIRQAYFEHPDYVPLLLRAYQLWHKLETKVSTPLFEPCGLLEVGPEDGELIPGIRESVRQHHLQLQELTLSTAATQFPQFVIPKGSVAVFEPTAGFLHVENCVLQMQAAAIHNGADLRFEQAVESIEFAGQDRILVRTTVEPFATRRLIITAGSWASKWLSQSNIPLRILRKQLQWFATNDLRFQSPHCPAFFYECANGWFYGFPAIDQAGVKVAEHSGGIELVSPEAVDRALDASEAERSRAFCRQYLPSITSPVVRHDVCLYTMSPDQHFLVDHLSELPGTVFAAGLSGHGFKFATVLGQALTELAMDGGTDLPIQFLRSSRFAG